MTRDKQLQVRLESDVREKFKELCQRHDLEMSAFLYSLIRHFVDGSIPIENFLKPTDSALHSEGIADLKKSILAELSPMIRGEVEKAIAELTPPAQIPLTQADQTINFETLPLSDGVIQGDLLGEVEAAIEPSDITEKIQESIEGQDINIPHWLVPNREYEQADFAAAIGCHPGTITKVFKGDIKKSRKADLNVLLSLKDSGKLTQTKGGKWIYNL